MSTTEITEFFDRLESIIKSAVQKPDLMKKPLWTIEDIAQYLDVSVKAAQKYIDMYRFPTPYQITERTLRWNPDDVMAWLKTTRR